MRLAKRNHYNPCFWTAHWNSDYLDGALAGQRDHATVRQQRVFALNIKSNRIYQTTVENVHYDKNFGVAEITPNAAKSFCKKYFPDKYHQFCKDMTDHPETLYLDFESFLTGLEATQAYTTLLNVIARGGISSSQEKGFIAGFVLYHHMRSHAIMNSMLELNAEIGRQKFEYFWILKQVLGNTELMYSRIMLFAPGRWKFFKLDNDTFPLNDTPILVQPESIMVALSPRLLLEIDCTQHQAETVWECINLIPAEKLNEFRLRTISNTFREIIFGDEIVLENWRQSSEFQVRHQLMADIDSYNKLIAKHATRDLWKINAYRNT